MYCHRYTIISICCFAILNACRPTIAADGVGKPFVYVCRDAGAGGYQAFPDVCSLQDGRLIATFYAGYGHLAFPNAQLPKGGRISFCVSTDHGHSWSKAETLYDGPQDDRDPSMTQLKDGRLICCFFSLKKATNSWGGLGSFIITSDDLGKNWSQPRCIYNDYYCSSPIRELSNGRLVLPLYRETAKSAAGAVGISDDGGKTWSKAVDIDNAGYRLDAETDLIELRDGRLWAVLRAADGPACFATSSDRGNTWTKSQRLDFVAHSPYLLRAQNGNAILLAYRGFDKSGGFTALRYSLDECKTWSPAVKVDSFLGAYPAMVNLKDGSVLIVYYEEGPKSSIRAKRFQLAPTGIEWLAP